MTKIFKTVFAVLILSVAFISCDGESDPGRKSEISFYLDGTAVSMSDDWVFAYDKNNGFDGTGFWGEPFAGEGPGVLLEIPGNAVAGSNYDETDGIRFWYVDKNGNIYDSNMGYSNQTNDDDFNIYIDVIDEANKVISGTFHGKVEFNSTEYSVTNGEFEGDYFSY